MRIAVLGAGALGSLIGARLALCGHDVQLLMRNQAHREAIRQNGLTLTIAGKTQSVPLHACSAAEAASPIDLIILLTKTYQSDAALNDAIHLLNENTAVLSLQNGLGNAQRIAEHLPLAQVYVGISMLPAVLTGPGQVSSQGAGHTRLYAADARDRPLAHKIAAAFQQAHMDCEADPNIEIAIWEKAAFNAATNALLAVTANTPGAFLKCPEAMSLARGLAAEAVTIARAVGVQVELSRVTDLLDLSSNKHPNHKPSMAQDIAAGRRTEVDAINGAFARQAESLGIAAPLNDTIWRIVRLAESGFAA